MFKTITAKYAGICRRCNGPIAIGQKIRYGGPGRSYHLKAECPAGTDTDAGEIDTAAIAIADGADPADPAYAPIRRRQYGSTYTRLSSGAEIYTNRRGRCEDAPCCGCCS